MKPWRKSNILYSTYKVPSIQTHRTSLLCITGVCKREPASKEFRCWREGIKLVLVPVSLSCYLILNGCTSNYLMIFRVVLKNLLLNWLLFFKSSLLLRSILNDSFKLNVARNWTLYKLIITPLFANSICSFKTFIYSNLTLFKISCFWKASKSITPCLPLTAWSHVICIQSHAF